MFQRLVSEVESSSSVLIVCWFFFFFFTTFMPVVAFPEDVTGGHEDYLVGH